MLISYETKSDKQPAMGKHSPVYTINATICLQTTRVEQHNVVFYTQNQLDKQWQGMLRFLCLKYLYIRYMASDCSILGHMIIFHLCDVTNAHDVIVTSQLTSWQPTMGFPIVNTAGKLSQLICQPKQFLMNSD